MDISSQSQLDALTTKQENSTDANGFKNMVCCGGNGCVIDNELVENIPLDKDGCIKIIHQAEELGYGWCVALDDTKDVYMTDDKFLRQVGKRKRTNTLYH